MTDTELARLAGMKAATEGDDPEVWADAFNAHAQARGYPKMDRDWLIGWFDNVISSAEMVRIRRKLGKHGRPL